MERCPKIDSCSTIRAIKDQDLAGDWQFREIVEAACAECKKRRTESEKTNIGSNGGDGIITGSADQ
jgi:hypothetical protein